MKAVLRKLLLAACLIASMVIPVYANAPRPAPGESVEVTGLPAFLLLGFLVLCGIVITCFAEWLVSLAFSLKRRISRLVLWTNAVSQILMWLGYFLLSNLPILSHIWIVVILEVLIYAGEFLFYRWKMHDVGWLKCLIYTVAANTASLLLGLLIL